MRLTLSKTIVGMSLVLAGRMPAQSPIQSLGGASLEDLMNMEVTSVSKKEQILSKTGAAVFIISKEDIRRSGATTIPDLLRLAPGVEVAQLESNVWAVSIRGFNSTFANKVLVLIDGRSVYADSFSGVYWDQVQMPLEDIERIEIIRGPGGTVWGANAVNGVINIITQSPLDTKGVLVTGGFGSKTTGDGLIQYGGNLGSDSAFRVYSRYRNTDDQRFPGGAMSNDGWHSWQTGFRSDWSPSSRNTFSLQSDLLDSAGGQTSNVVTTSPLGRMNIENSLNNISGDALGRWTHTLDGGSELSLQVYDTLMRRENAGIRVNSNAVDVDLEHHISLGSHHDVVWGLDYRVYTDKLHALTDYAVHLTEPARTDQLYAAFVQDEIRLAKSLFLTIGSKFEHNAYTGLEFEPSAQLVWQASDRYSLWASAARAIRQPDHSENSAQYTEAIVPIPGAGPALLTIAGNPRLQAERLNDYEAGYRARLNSRLSVDATAFLSFYHELNTLEPQTPDFVISGGLPLMVLPLKYANSGRARDYGLELYARWNVSRRWEISPGYSMLRMNTSLAAGSHDSYVATMPGSSPRYQPQVRSLVSLPRHVEWDSSLKFVSALPALNVPGYLRVDSRLGWHPGESTEISVTAQNLTSGRHIEFVDFSSTYLTTEVARSVFGKIAWRF